MTSRLPSANRSWPAIPRPCAFIASFGSTRVARSAGTVPKITAVATATAAVNPSTRQSSVKSRCTLFVAVDSCAHEQAG